MGDVETEPIEPEPEPEGEPEPATTSDDPLAAGVARMDAPLAVRQQFFRPTVGGRVSRPGQAEVAGTGDRDPQDGRHAWVPIGPRNVGGRVRAIAIDPDNPQVMYAAPASGGVYKTLDGADSWFPLWHDEASLSLGALAISPSNTQVIWAGTGETVAGGGETIPAAGVLRSTNGGESWSLPSGAFSDDTRIHALAAHPTDDAVCWAATDQGLFRTMDGGADWTLFLGFRAITDVVFARVGGSLRLFAALSGFGVDPGPPERHRPLVIRIDDPDNRDGPAVSTSATLTALLPEWTGDATLPDPLFPLTGTFPAPPAGGREPADAKLALYPGGAPGFANPVLYVVYANDRRSFFGLFRCRNLGANAPTGLNWTRLATLPVFRREEQGNYNLALAVSPLNPNHLAFGMVELYLNENANANTSNVTHWKRAQMWDLFMIERGHHADHHQLVFSPAPAAPFDGGLPAGTMLLWDANDGGVSSCADWPGSTTYTIHDEDVEVQAAATLPLPAGAPTWRKRSHGISASQMYDLAQHPRLPSVLACGFQDNGAFLATGGPSWQLLLAADGGFIAFDPDDPYRLIVTWQEGISESRFPGRLRQALPLLGEAVQGGLWPRQLADGILHRDQAPFVAETAFHPTQPGRVLTARRNRVYGTQPTTGERWVPQALGHGIEILHRPTAAAVTRSTIEVEDTLGARALGFVPQRVVTEFREDRRMVSRVRSLAGEPFAIPNGQKLTLSFGSDAAGVAAARVEVPLTVGPDLPAQATAVQLAAYLRREIRRLLPAGANRPDVDVLPVLWRSDTSLFVVSTGAGRGETIRFDSSDPFMFGVFVPRDFLGAGARGGGPALPAVVPMSFGGGPAGTSTRDMTLHFERENGTAVVDIACNTEFPDPDRVFLADLVAMLRRRLPAEHYSVWTCPIAWGLTLTATAAGAQVTLSGNLVPDLSLEPGETGRTVRIANRSDLNLDPTDAGDRRLRVAEAGHQTAAAQALDAGFLGVAGTGQVTMVELCDALRRLIDAAGNVRVRCDLDLHPAHEVDERDPLLWTTSREGEATEFAFGPVRGKRIWVGDSGGRLYRSRDDGDSWTQVASPFAERYGVVEAIAVRPDRHTTVVIGAYVEGAHLAPAAFLFRSLDDGATWQPAARPPIVAATDERVGVRALVFDPAVPGHVYAATDIGVFESIDSGDTWVGFNQGLPNVRIVDLTYEPTTRMLRAGAWGRGVYERHLGTRPAKNVRLHIRSTELDDGTAQPYPGPDLLAVSPLALPLDASPDVKQLRRDPRRGVVLDGVEFDEEVVSTDVRIGPAFVAVQVHNRGASSTETARVAVLWAPADDGPPPLPVEARTAFADADVPAGTRFGSWTVVADGLFPDPHDVGHDILAPGYPRIAIAGVSPAFEWRADDLDGHTRVGLLALTRSSEDPLRIATSDVFELVRTEPKSAYRECPVVDAAVDALTVIRVTRGTGFRVQAPTDGSANAANGAAPFGLAATAAAVLEARFARPEPYDLSGGDVGFRLSFVHDVVVVPFTAGEPAFRNIARTDAIEVAAVINRALVAADVPVRATSRNWTVAGVGANNAVRLDALRGARFTVDGTAGLLGLNAGTATARSETPLAQRGPWNLTPPAAGARELRLHVTTAVGIRLGRRTPELANPAAATAVEVRAAVNRQLAQGGLTTVVAEPLRVALSVRRSATEGARSRSVTGGYTIADLVCSASAIDLEDRPERFRVLAAHDADRLVAGRENFLYVRVANVGTVRVAPARVRVFELTVTAAPVARSDAPLGSGNPELAPGESAMVEVAFDLDARPSGSRVFVLAVADLEDAPLDPPSSLPTLEDWHRFSLEHPQAAIRELVVA